VLSVLLTSLVACTSPKLSPEDSLISVIIERAQISDDSKTFHLSAKLYSKLVELQPDNMSNHIGFIRSVTNINDVNALKNYTKLSNNSRFLSDEEFVEFLVTSLLYHNLNDEAYELLNRAKNYNLAGTAILRLRGAVNINQGQYDRAEANYLDCLASKLNIQPCLSDYQKLLSNTHQTSKLLELERKYKILNKMK